MAALLKAVYLLIALSIAADIINLRGYWYNNVEDITVHSSSLILPGANGWFAGAARAASAASAISKSAKKAAKRREKNQQRAQGNAKNKAKKSQGGAGKFFYRCCFSNKTQSISPC